MKKKFLLAAALTAAVAALTPSAAFAGEVTGNGQHKAINGNSPCVYSGLNDNDPADGGSGRRCSPASVAELGPQQGSVRFVIVRAPGVRVTSC